MTRLTLDSIAIAGFGTRFNSFEREELDSFLVALGSALGESLNIITRLPIQQRFAKRAKAQYDADIAEMNALVDGLTMAYLGGLDAAKRIDFLAAALEDARTAGVRTRELTGPEALRPFVVEGLVRAGRTVLAVAATVRDAEDLTEQTFLQAYRHFERALRESKGRPLRPWLIRIAHNLAANYYRDRSRRPQTNIDDAGALSTPHSTAPVSRTAAPTSSAVA